MFFVKTEAKAVETPATPWCVVATVPTRAMEHVPANSKEVARERRKHEVALNHMRAL